MQSSNVLTILLQKARQYEEKHQWLSAMEQYAKSMSLVDESSLQGEIQEGHAFALYMAARQAESVEEFRGRMQESMSSYATAEESWSQLSDPLNSSRKLRVKAMHSFLESWLAPSAEDRKRLIDETWRLTKDTLQAFLKIGSSEEYGKTFNQLSGCANLAYALEGHLDLRRKIVTEAIEYGGHAITLLSKMNRPQELARSYAKTAVYLGFFAMYFASADEREQHSQRANEFWVKSKALSEEHALFELATPWAGEDSLEILRLSAGAGSSFSAFEKALEYGERIRDNYVTGSALDFLAYHTCWKFYRTQEDPAERLRVLNRAFDYAEEAQKRFSKLCFVSPRGGVFSLIIHTAEFLTGLAGLEVDRTRKQDHLESAREAVDKALERANESGYAEITGYAHYIFSDILHKQASITTDVTEKTRILQEALMHGEEFEKLVDPFRISQIFDRGVIRVGIAHTKAQLANLTNDVSAKTKLLEDAVLQYEEALRFLLEGVGLIERFGSVAYYPWIGGRQYDYGDMLQSLHEITRLKGQLQKAIRAYTDAISSFQRDEILSRIAECHWKIAQSWDSLGDYQNAAENFNLASNNYKGAAQKIPQLQPLYGELSLYMQAWSEIDSARSCHEKQEYRAAKDYYERAASLHKSTQKWAYLSPNYLAWSRLEQAEDLSRGDYFEDAVHAFENARELFQQARKSLEAELSRLETHSEIKMAQALAKAADVRAKYSAARVALEKARSLERKGEYGASVEKYRIASQSFENLMEASEREEDRSDLRLILGFTRAWQTMAEAEAKASSELFRKASELFEEVGELSPGERTTMLSLGHSQFCKALEVSAGLIGIGEEARYEIAIHHLEKATDYYLKAGFANASAFCKGSKLLIEAYRYLNNASGEKDSERKARLLTAVEKVLNAASSFFQKAGYEGKREHAIRLLETVREERELAISLTDILHSPAIISSTEAFTLPAPSHEKAVGLERFEHADIEAKLLLSTRNVKVGQELELEIEFVNAGRGPAQLIKIEELMPENFEIVSKPELYRIEENYLNMKGRRLDPLKTEEVKLTLRAKIRGHFSLKPSVLYVDESGKYKTCQPEAAKITVKELGISGWVKGEAKSRD